MSDNFLKKSETRFGILYALVTAVHKKYNKHMHLQLSPTINTLHFTLKSLFFTYKSLGFRLPRRKSVSVYQEDTACDFCRGGM